MGLGRARGGRQSRSVCTSLPSLPAWLRITTSWKAFQNKFPGHKVDAVLILPSKQTEQLLQRFRVMDIEHVSMDMEPNRPRFWLGTKRCLWGKRTWPNLADLGAFRQPGQSRAASAEIHANRARAQSRRHLHGPGEPSILLLCSAQNILYRQVLKVPELSVPVGPLAAKETRLCSVLSEFLLRNAHHILPFLGTA